MLLALDIDNTLIDTRPSFTRIVQELSGASDEDIALFKSTGMYNDDWELIRAFIAWRDAGRPLRLVSAGVGVDVLLDVLAEFDPGDMSAPAAALYRSGYWRDERVLVDAALLHAVAARHRVVACTGRDTWEFERAHIAASAPRSATPHSRQTRQRDEAQSFNSRMNTFRNCSSAGGLFHTPSFIPP